MQAQDEYRITSVTLKNYRQYYKEQTAKFSDRTEGFSVFIGENGEGKSNLLNAINWCFFRKEPHRRKSKHQPIINTKYLHELKDGSLAEMLVQVDLEKGNDKFRISRVLKGLKNQLQYETFEGVDFIKIIENTNEPVPEGFEVLEDQSTVAFLKSTSGGKYEDMTKTTDFTVLINELLPEGLSQFFILDGEFLEKLFDNFEHVEDGIKQISQLKLVDEAIQNIEKISSRIPPGISTEIDDITKKINQRTNIVKSLDDKGNESFSDRLMWKFDEEEEDKYYHSSGYPLIKDLSDEIEKMENKIKEFSRQIGDTNAPTIKSLQEQELNVETQYNGLKREYDKLFDSYRESLVKFGPIVFLKDAITKTNHVIESEVEKGTLPTKIKVIFTDDLLNRGKCVCGADLNGEHNPAREKVQKTRDEVAKDEGMDIAVYMRFNNQNLLRNYDSTLKAKFDDTVKELARLHEEKEKVGSQLKGIRLKMKNTGSQNVTKLIDQQDFLIEAIKERQTEIGQIQEKMESNKKAVSDLKNTLSQLEAKDLKAKKLTHRMNIWNKSLATLIRVFDELKAEIKGKVQEKTTEIFKQIMWKEDFEKIVIDSKYNLKLLNRMGYDAMQDLSAGEKLFMALSFIAAIREITGYRFPLIIDTPLGKISGTPRTLLAQKLPNFLPNSQLTLLTTDTEYIAPIPNIDTSSEGQSFKQILNQSINTKEFRIKFNKKDSTSVIIPYGKAQEVMA